MLGGAILPSIALAWGWLTALICVSIFSTLMAFAVQPLRKYTDHVASVRAVKGLRLPLVFSKRTGASAG